MRPKYFKMEVAGSGPKFRTIVEQSEAYTDGKKAIIDRIAKDFDKLQALVDKYEACRAVDNF
jgi:hypothetical protein